MAADVEIQFVSPAIFRQRLSAREARRQECTQNGAHIGEQHYIRPVERYSRWAEYECSHCESIYRGPRPPPRSFVVTI